MSTALENLNLEEAKSEELRAVFAGIADATAPDGSPRYSAKICRELIRIIVCRSYAKPVLEMCYFIAATESLGLGYAEAVWGVPRATPAAFRGRYHRYREHAGQVGSLNRVGLRFSHDDVAFNVSYGRLPFLASLIEFAISSLGYEAFDALLVGLMDEGVNADRVMEAARNIQKELYSYLQDHLPPAQRQRRERHFLSYVGERVGAHAPADAINDDMVLSYWRDHAMNDTVDARTYKSVFETASTLLLALHAATERLAASKAKRIGVDIDAGEVDPADVEYIVATMDADSAPSEKIRERCGTLVNFITGAESDIASEVPTSRLVSRQLPISALRNAVYGAQQTRFSVGLRVSLAHLEGLMPIPGAPVYRDRLKAYSKTADRLERICYAAVWVLYCHGENGAIVGALRLAPDIDWGALRESALEESEEDVVSFHAHSAAKSFFATEPDVRGSEIAAFLAEAKRICRRVNREGFCEPVSTDAVLVLNDVLLDVLNLVDLMRTQLRSDFSAVSWPDVEQSDAALFAEMFRSLYIDNKGVRSHAG